jgi:hypothetical protein
VEWIGLERREVGLGWVGWLGGVRSLRYCTSPFIILDLYVGCTDLSWIGAGFIEIALCFLPLLYMSILS